MKPIDALTTNGYDAELRKVTISPVTALVYSADASPGTILNVTEQSRKFELALPVPEEPAVKPKMPKAALPPVAGVP